MRGSLYASGALHVGLVAWVLWGADLFDRQPELEFEVTGVTLMSAAEFEALTDPSNVISEPVVDPEPVVFDPPQIETPPETPAPEAPPEPIDAPEEVAAPAPESAPVPVEPLIDTTVQDDVALLAPPPGATEAEPDPLPVPDEAPRIAPSVAPPPEPNVETAPEVQEQTTEPAPSELPVEEEPETAPEEATTEIVTEADEPAAALSPTSSVRPPPRPARPEPPEPVEEVAEASAEPTPDPVQDPQPDPTPDPAPAADPAPAQIPLGPPLSQGARDGFRVAVEGCWNVGSLSTEAARMTFVVAFDMNPDGQPVSSSLRLQDYSGGSDAAAQRAFDAARRAILRCGRNGYDLPVESYGRWAQVELVFNPNGVNLQ